MWIKLIPWAGWPLAALMFFFWVGLKEDLAQQVEICNVQKLETIAAAERMSREALLNAREREQIERDSIIQAEREARLQANLARETAELKADEAQAIIRRLIEEAGNNEDATVAQVCLNTDVPDSILDSIRVQ